jgi:hypothetical protein
MADIAPGTLSSSSSRPSTLRGVALTIVLAVGALILYVFYIIGRPVIWKLHAELTHNSGGQALIATSDVALPDDTGDDAAAATAVLNGTTTSAAAGLKQRLLRSILQ